MAAMIDRLDRHIEACTAGAGRRCQSKRGGKDERPLPYPS